jgi:hypothetical protein
LTEHEAPTAKAATQFGTPAGNVPVVTLEKGCGVPPLKVNVPPARGELPVFVTSRARTLLAVPIAQMPNASGLGDTLAVRVAAAPVPLSETGDPGMATLEVIETVPAYDVTAVGVNTMLIVQVVPAAAVAPQVPPDLENGPVMVRVIPLRPRVPVLCRVRDCAALVAPAITLPNANGPPVTLPSAVFAGATNSTAPASTALSVFRRVP